MAWQHFDILAATQQPLRAYDCTMPSGGRAVTKHLTQLSLAALCLSLSLSCAPTPPSASVAIPKSEIFALSWSPPNSGNIAHIYPMVRFTPKTTPESLIQSTQEAKQGRVALLLVDGQRSVLGNSQDACADPLSGALTKYQCPYLANGTKATKTIFNDYFSKYSAIGGRIDFLILDSEIALSNWVLGSTPAPYDAIEHDYRFRSDAVPDLIRLATAADLPAPELRPLSRVLGTDLSNRNEIELWNELMYERVGNALAASVFVPLSKFFPTAQMSDFDYFAHNSKYPIYDLNGWPVSKFGFGAVVGTTGAPSIYGVLAGIQLPSLSPSGQAYTPTPFNGFRFDVNTVRGTLLGSTNRLNAAAGTANVSPWIPFRGFKKSTYANTDFYQEMIFHAVLSGADYLLLWNPSEAHDKSINDDAIVSSTLTELNELVGYSDRKTLVTTLVGWTDNMVVTTMYANNRKVSRLTTTDGSPPTCITSTDDKLLLTCVYGNSRMHFQGGHEFAFVGKSSSAGLWVIQPHLALDPY